MMDEFTTAEIQTDKTSIFVRSCGSGPPVLLLHGFPQTHLMWHGVAPLLARHFAVVCADLRGYRRSSCPASAPNHAPYAKRSMARDLVSMMQQLGFERFSVAGHDRGGRVAYRMAPDHPDRVDRLAVLDILPTETVWERAEEGGPIALWRAWCDEVQGLALDAGHFFPEEAPEQTADALNLKNRQTFALFTTRYSPTNWWKRVLPGLKREDSSVSCAYENVHRADECLAGILPQPGVYGKRTSGARQYCHPWTPAPTLPVQDLRENV